MRSLPARFVVLLAAVLFVTAGLLHATHSHADEAIATLHPACTLCQFHAPSAAIGDVHGHLLEPPSASRCAAHDAGSTPVDIPVAVHTPRAPPVRVSH